MDEKEPKAPITKANFSKLVDVSRPAVTKACVNQLKDAWNGKHIDLEHTDTIKYIEKQKEKQRKKALKLKNQIEPVTKESGKKTTEIESKETIKSESVESEDDEDSAEFTQEQIDENTRKGALKKYMGKTLHEIHTEFGSDYKFKTLVEAVKQISDINWKQVQTAKAEGILIPRDFVQKHVFSSIEDSNLRLLSHAPGTIVKRIRAMVKAGEGSENCEEVVLGILSGHVKNSKDTAIKQLNQKNIK